MSPGLVRASIKRACSLTGFVCKACIQFFGPDIRDIMNQPDALRPQWCLLDHKTVLAHPTCTIAHPHSALVPDYEIDYLQCGLIEPLGDPCAKMEFVCPKQ